MTTSSPETLEDFAIDSSTPIPPACDSSEESQEDVPNNMLEVASTIMSNVTKHITRVCNDTTKKISNICYEGISRSPLSKKAYADIRSELSLSVDTRSYSLTTKNTTVLDEANFHYFDNIMKHADVVKDILRECGEKNTSNQGNENNERRCKMICENYYLQHQYCKKIFLSMCIGMEK